MFVPDKPHQYDRSEQLDYWLRRAEEESIAAIRSPDKVAAERHDSMAQAYSALAMHMLAEQPAN